MYRKYLTYENHHILNLGQFLPASERCDDPLLAVLESPSIVHLLLDQMFMHIKCSSKLDQLTTDSEQPISQTSSPPKENTPKDPPNEEDDAGGGNIIYNTRLLQ